jgi:hypothetical protein
MPITIEKPSIDGIDTTKRERMVHIECALNNDKACCGYKFPPDAKYTPHDELDCIVCAQMDYNNCPCLT